MNKAIRIVRYALLVSGLSVGLVSAQTTEKMAPPTRCTATVSKGGCGSSTFPSPTTVIGIKPLTGVRPLTFPLIDPVRPVPATLKPLTTLPRPFTTPATFKPLTDPVRPTPTTLKPLTLPPRPTTIKSLLGVVQPIKPAVVPTTLSDVNGYDK